MNWDFEEKLIRTFYPHGGKGGGGGVPASIQQRERELEEEIAESREAFQTELGRQQTAFQTRISELQEQSEAQLANVTSVFQTQLSEAEKARQDLLDLNKQLTQRIGAESVGLSRAGTEPTRVSPVTAGRRRFATRASTILASAEAGTTKKSLGAPIQL